MSKETITFIDMCINGDVLYEDIDDHIDIWHDSDSEEELFEFLGMTHDEYVSWVNNPGILPFIITAHKENTDISNILNQDQSLPLAARSNLPSETERVFDWLDKKGHLD